MHEFSAGDYQELAGASLLIGLLSPCNYRAVHNIDMTIETTC